MQYLAVFGKPVLHSKSPQLFNSAFKSTGIKAFYTRIRPLSGENIIEIIKRTGITGANVTTPYKEDVIPFLDYISNDARLIGGVNTIVNQNGTLYGYNTDHYGVSRSLTEAGFTLHGLPCLVLGAGPAARAAVYGLMGKGAVVSITNRTFSKALSIANDFGCRAVEVERVNDIIGDVGIMVSTILPGANPLSDVTLPDTLTVLDANYRVSQFSIYADAYGCRIISGKRWLINQAAESFKLFLGAEPDIAALEDGLSVELDKNKLNVVAVTEKSQDINFSNVDLVVSLPSAQLGCFNTFLDEEVYKAFGN